MERTAQCHCGSLRAIAVGQPRINNICHCRACQRRTGSLLHAGAYFLKADVRCEGPNNVYTRRADSGFDSHWHFCPDCGTTVYWRLDRTPDFVGIAVGCFVDPDFPPPQWSGWEEVMHPWLGIPASIERFPQGIGVGLAAKIAAALNREGTP